jgi:polyisoprenyl-teichoic acid--peptidoglycan teichoic acid transferase
MTMTGSKRRSKGRKFPLFKLLGLVVLAIATFSLTILAQIIPPQYLDWQGLFQGRNWQEVVVEATGKRLNHSYQILVMGVDRVPNAAPGSAEIFNGRADTILLTNFAPQGKASLQVLAIPRDTQVAIAGYGRDKVNAANVYGGAKLATQTISNFLGGVRIDRYVRLDTQALVSFIDAIGGVEIDVPKRMKYQDKTQKLEIDLYPGKQTLNGKQAEGLIRFRSDGAGDIGRVKRQHLLIEAIKTKITNPLVLIRFPQIIAGLSAYIDTDLSSTELWNLASFGLTLPPSQVQLYSLPGRPSGDYEFNASYWIVSDEEADLTVKGKFELIK